MGLISHMNSDCGMIERDLKILGDRNFCYSCGEASCGVGDDLENSG